MIKIEKTDIVGWEHAIRGMRNPKNSWAKTDSDYVDYDNGEGEFLLGANDYELMKKLASGGPTHAKYRRMIVVYVDITAPLYWWKEFDTYKVGTVANSCSTMHKIADKEFTLDDFSHEHLGERSLKLVLEPLIEVLNTTRRFYNFTKDKSVWWEMILLLPSSYNQKRTVMLNYEVLAGIYPMRKDHKLDEWHTFCDWIKTLPYSELITGEFE